MSLQKDEGLHVKRKKNNQAPPLKEARTSSGGIRGLVGWFETLVGCVGVYCQLIPMLIKRNKTGNKFEASLSSATLKRKTKQKTFKLPLRHLIVKN